MKVHVLFFGVLAHRLGADQTMLELPPDATVRSLLDALAAKYAEVRAMREKIAVAVNLEYVGLDRPLAEGDEVAIIPPVSGG